MYGNTELRVASTAWPISLALRLFMQSKLRRFTCSLKSDAVNYWMWYVSSHCYSVTYVCVAVCDSVMVRVYVQVSGGCIGVVSSIASSFNVALFPPRDRVVRPAGPAPVADHVRGLSRRHTRQQQQPDERRRHSHTCRYRYRPYVYMLMHAHTHAHTRASILSHTICLHASSFSLVCVSHYRRGCIDIILLLT